MSESPDTEVQNVPAAEATDEAPAQETVDQGTQAAEVDSAPAAGEATADGSQTAASDAAAQAEVADAGTGDASEPAEAAEPAAVAEAAEPAAPAEETGSAATSAPTDDASAEEAAPAETAAPATPIAGESNVASVAAEAQTPDTDSKPATSTPAPTPKPRPVPKPTALRATRPGPAPSAVAPAASAPTAPPADDAELIAEAKKFGTVAEDGTVSVRDGETVRVVGQVPGATAADEALDLYVRRYLDLRTKVTLFETRLSAGSVTPNDATATLKSLTEELQEPHAVGDLPSLRSKLVELEKTAAQQAEVAEAERKAAREQAVVERTAIVDAAEALAAADPSRVQWKTASEKMHGLLDRWKHAQKTGPRIDRPTEDALWKRFSHARTAFDRERRHFFASLEEQHTKAKAAKEKLIAEAEKLSTSIAWGDTAAAYRDLMAQWKQAGHAGRRDDDALWSRFRAAQDKFFTARNAASSQLDAEFAENLKVKEALLVEAEALLPITDIQFAKTRLRDVQDRWEAAGKVPRESMHSVEARLRAVETAVRDFEDDQWKRSNPEVKARATGMSAQLTEAIERLEADLAAATSAGDAKAIREIEDGLAARRSWLSQIEKAAGDS
ncbi:DUF349 domain-containing protein [Rarobacter faecitabidus]|uniref:Uncharacterized protein DUF349 n=1 Tax=Rarobacter faecitabidus TaxID=13243 RepID=A0A542ZVE0_RARFA|nr:DUF349 domain-containing protein [Rarobacter faecitabidus]TQL64226.1 uncharacterized protein DUF349 [Rarobacter faecitabidus]